MEKAPPQKARRAVKSARHAPAAPVPRRRSRRSGALSAFGRAAASPSGPPRSRRRPRPRLPSGRPRPAATARPLALIVPSTQYQAPAPKPKAPALAPVDRRAKRSSRAAPRRSMRGSTCMAAPKAEAHAALASFLHRAQADGARTVLVITGKVAASDRRARRAQAAGADWLALPEFRAVVAGLATAHLAMAARARCMCGCAPARECALCEEAGRLWFRSSAKCSSRQSIRNCVRSSQCVRHMLSLAHAQPKRPAAVGRRLSSSSASGLLPERAMSRALSTSFQRELSDHRRPVP